MDETSSESEPPDSLQIHFTKMQGCGNDFIVIDELASNKPFEEHQKKRFYRLCNRNFAIGADQILLLEASSVADVRMRVLERDGSESDMCGNGIRCTAKYMIDKFGMQRPIKIETRAGLKTVEPFMNLFKVNMGVPTVPEERNYIFDGKDVKAYYINTGEPHIVIFVDDLEDTNFISLARFIRYGDEFSNSGVNVNFVQIVANNRIKIRTYERGVEGETLSCGTGSVACDVVSTLKRGLSSPIYVETKGGMLLIDYINSEAFLIGPAEFVFDSVVPPSRALLPQLEIQAKAKDKRA